MLVSTMAGCRKRRERAVDEEEGTTRDVSPREEAAVVPCPKRARARGWKAVPPGSSWPAVEVPTDADDDAFDHAHGVRVNARKRRIEGVGADEEGAAARPSKLARPQEEGGGGGGGGGGGDGAWDVMDDSMGADDFGSSTAGGSGGCSSSSSSSSSSALVPYLAVPPELRAPTCIARLPEWTAWAPVAPAMSLVSTGGRRGDGSGGASGDGGSVAHAGEEAQWRRRCASSHVVIEELPDDYDASRAPAAPQYMDVD